MDEPNEHHPYDPTNPGEGTVAGTSLPRSVKKDLFPKFWHRGGGWRRGRLRRELPVPAPMEVNGSGYSRTVALLRALVRGGGRSTGNPPERGETRS